MLMMLLVVVAWVVDEGRLVKAVVATAMGGVVKVREEDVAAVELNE